MPLCLPGRLPSGSRGRTTLRHLTFLLLIVGLLALWPKPSAADGESSAAWLALEAMGGSVVNDGSPLDSHDDLDPVAACPVAAVVPARLCSTGPILGWHPVPCVIQHARAPPALA